MLAVGRLSVVAISLAAILMALDRDSTVLALVAYAWAGFGASFGPVVILSLFWRRMTRNGALAGMVAGAITVIVWKQLTGGIFDLYEILPSFIVATLTIVMVSLAGREPPESVRAAHDAVAD